MTEEKKHIVISAPNFKTAKFEIEGTAPLVIRRFSLYDQKGVRDNQEEGSTAKSKKKKVAMNLEEICERSRYRIGTADGPDGFNASAIRKACISVCRLVSFKMTIAKMSIFTEADGRDYLEPQVPLVQIHGACTPQPDHIKTPLGKIQMVLRPAFYDWKAFPRIRWDADQFTIDDVFNLLVRVGMQAGICVGRPDSTNSAGMDWGLFKVNGGTLL